MWFGRWLMKKSRNQVFCCKLLSRSWPRTPPPRPKTQSKIFYCMLILLRRLGSGSLLSSDVGGTILEVLEWSLTSQYLSQHNSDHIPEYWFMILCTSTVICGALQSIPKIILPSSYLQRYFWNGPQNCPPAKNAPTGKVDFFRSPFSKVDKLK